MYNTHNLCTISSLLTVMRIRNSASIKHLHKKTSTKEHKNKKMVKNNLARNKNVATYLKLIDKPDESKVNSFSFSNIDKEREYTVLDRYNGKHGLKWFIPFRSSLPRESRRPKYLTL